MIKNILNGRVLIAILVVAGVLLCASLAYILIRRPAAPPEDLAPASAILTIIPAPTSTPHAQPPTVTPFPPTPTTSPTPAPGQFAVGVYVLVTNTGGEGLNIHADPSINSKVLFSGNDAEVFLIAEGPVDAEGFTWWRLTASYDVTRTGWAVQNYLSVIPSH
ncbi:MAG: hypothetical protein ABSG01_13875 [Anaerolineales bacterium]|jgi:hypothetical protein